MDRLAIGFLVFQNKQKSRELHYNRDSHVIFAFLFWNNFKLKVKRIMQRTPIYFSPRFPLICYFIPPFLSLFLYLCVCVFLYVYISIHTQSRNQYIYWLDFLWGRGTKPFVLTLCENFKYPNSQRTMKKKSNGTLRQIHEVELDTKYR